MIYCLNCGKGIPDQSKFCTFCGAATATADTNPSEINTPPVSEQTTNPIPPPPQFVSTPPPPVSEPSTNPIPPPPQFVSTQQQYIPPTPPLQQQYTPPPQMPPQYINPTQPYVQQYAATTSKGVVVAKNEFYKNAGFWGAVFVFIGFFLPFVNGSDASFYYLVSDLAPGKPELYLYLVFPVCSAVLIIQGLTGVIPKFLVVICKFLPLLLLILLIAGASQAGGNFSFMGDDVGTILKNIGVGLYMTVVGTILMLFFKTTKIKA